MSTASLSSAASNSASAVPLNRLRRRRLIGTVLAVLVFSFALIACYHLLREINPAALSEALAKVPLTAIGGAVLLTLLGFTALVGYEWSASHYAGVQLPSRVLIGGGACAFAISNAVGLSMFSGGAVRYRLYARHGLTTPDVARMSLFASLSLGCSLPLLAALAALSDPAAAAQALRFSEPLVVTVALVLIAAYAVLGVGLAWSRRCEHPNPHSFLLYWGRFSVRLPGLKLSALQLLITLVEIGRAHV